MARELDPVLVEVIRNELAAVSEEMAIATVRTARGPMAKAGDLTTAITDADGRPLGVGEGLGLFMFFSLAGGLVKRIRNKFGPDIAPGDIFIVNDPYDGASHMPDLWVVAPQFCDGKLAAFAALYTHHVDIGGRFPSGQSGQCTETYEEGLRIPLSKLVDAGKLNETLLDVILANVRGADEYRGDVEGKLTGCWRATQGINDVFAKYGLDNFNACFDRVHAYTKAAALKAIAAMPRGEFTAELTLPDNGFGEQDPELVMRVRLRVETERLVFDFTGSGRQARGAINLPVENARGAVFATCRRLLFNDIPLNSGMMETIDIILPSGSVVNPEFPGAVGGRAMTMFLFEDLLHRVLAKAMPGKIPVPCERWDLLHFTSRRPDGGDSVIMDAMPGGWGARPTLDGPDGISQSAVSDIPIEILELDHTLVIEGVELVTDSAGPGTFRGSQAINKTVRYLTPGRLLIRTNKIVPTPGFDGGQAGIASANILHHAGATTTLPGAAYLHLDIQPGDVIEHRVNGCGGFGDPLHRDAALVLKDVQDDRLTIPGALAQYGVVIDAARGSVDAKATQAARTARATRTSAAR
jgi:N-methylhydantoinase B